MVVSRTMMGMILNDGDDGVAVVWVSRLVRHCHSPRHPWVLAFAGMTDESITLHRFASLPSQTLLGPFTNAPYGYLAT